MLLGQLAKRNAKRHPQKIGVVSGSVRLSFGDFNRRVNSLANALIDMGLERQDRVAIILDSSHQYLELYFAVPKAGGVVVPLNTALGVPEMTYILNHAEVKMLVFGERFAALVDSLLTERDSLKTIVVGAVVGGEGSYEELMTRYPATEPEVEADEQDIAYLIYTSGTTGTPKGIMETHRGVIESALNTVLGCHLREQDIGLVSVPLFWGAIIVSIVIPNFYVGSTLVLADSYAPEAVIDIIQKERITTGFLTPPMITAMLESPSRADYDVSHLRHVLYAGVPMAAETLKQALKTFGNVFFQNYGTTEFGPLTLVDPAGQVVEGPPEKVRRLASCGQEALNVELKVVDDEGREVSSGEVGEVIARGDNVMKGYWRMPQVTEEALKGGYFHTGDLAMVDEDGYIYLVGRKKDIINCAGKTIYPVEVEEVIYQYPGVLEAAVIGVPDEKLGEAVKAVVVIRQGEEATENDILDFCRQRLPDYASPGSVLFLEKLPRNPAGKILRRALRERA
ncbi:long-chain-fatty-acid--CoA ligase [Chloroflexota bacterium]